MPLQKGGKGDLAEGGEEADLAEDGDPHRAAQAGNHVENSGPLLPQDGEQSMGHTVIHDNSAFVHLCGRYVCLRGAGHSRAHPKGTLQNVHQWLSAAGTRG